MIFFCFIVVFSCSKKSTLEITKVYNNSDKVIGIEFNTKSPSDAYNIFLKGNATPVLGTFTTAKDRLTFKPIIPFTFKQSYQVYKGTTLVSEFTIPALQNEIVPVVEHIYPTSTIVPENLLKMYFVFSQPMQEVGNILDYITVTNTNENLKKEVFLKLESELWNKEHTVLTLWLDPGRIKTDLIPNKEKGLPIRNGNSYSLSIKKELKSAKGIRMSKDYVKNFEVVKRDNLKPNITNWKLNVLEKNSTKELTITLDEPLDAILLQETISIFYQGKKIDGEFRLTNKERVVHFKPALNWQSGPYKIIVSSVLEDLAGNNLNRLFDNNLDVKANENNNTPNKSILFTVE